MGPTTEKNGVKVLKVGIVSNLIIGDTIIEVNREHITTVDKFVELIEKINKTGRNSLLLKIIAIIQWPKQKICLYLIHK